MNKFVGVRMLDGSEWGFGLLAGVKRGLKTRDGVLFIDALSGVEIVMRMKLVRDVTLGRQSYQCSRPQA
jgi:hypothetical protein